MSAHRRPTRWVLPEDGIVDEIAVAIAAAGTRPVALTRTERWLAARPVAAKAKVRPAATDPEAA